MGYFRLTRAAAPVYISNSGAGTFSVEGTNPNSMVQIGTPFGQPWGWDLPFTINFTYAAIINQSELTALFDLYKIVKVEVYATYNHNVSTAGGTSAMPTLMWWPDPDNAAVETVTDMRERMGLRRKAFTADHRTRKMWVSHPRKMAALFDVATGALNVAQPMGGWTDCDDINIPHYGIKGCIENMIAPSTANVSSVRFDIKFTVVYKHAR